MFSKEWMNTLKKYCLVGTFTLLAGCATMSPVVTETESGNKNLSVENILKIEKGKTTSEEIKKLFGEPDLKYENASDKSTSWVYDYSKTRKRSMERAPFAIDQTQLEITFNNDGIVKEYTHTVSNKTKKD